MESIAKLAARIFAVTTFALVIVDVLFVPQQNRVHFLGWTLLSIAFLFLSIGGVRYQQSRIAGTLYIGVGLFLVLVVLITMVFAPTPAR